MLMLKRLAPRLSHLAIITLFIFSYAASSVSAAQPSKLKGLQWPLYDPGSDSSCDSSTTSATPGSGQPDGNIFPNLDPGAMANAINKWITQENPNSKLNGLGNTIVAGAKNSNINPFLIVAIAHKESSLADPSDFNVSHGSNAFGREATASQPHFVGAHLWYKWSSVKASVDYTAAENQNAAGGGDIASYLREQFGDAIDHGTLSDFFSPYAPPGENDTVQYIADVKGWMKDLINLTQGGGGSTPTTGTTDPADSCATGNGAVSGDIVQTALHYAWPDYHSAPYTRMRPAYASAIAKAQSNGEYVGGASGEPGIDCGGFVTRVMRDSGADPNYNWGPNDGRQGPTTSQQAYMDAHPDKYQKLSGINNDTSKLQPGDIAVNSEHTYIFVGRQKGFHGNAASASVAPPARSPMASTVYFSNSAGAFSWYRLKTTDT
jgi:hypothetical protein